MKHLTDKKIILAVTGSIAAVECVKLIHSLRRDGAIVQPVMSEAAQGIIHPDALTYAADTETITHISGHVEHVKWCGDDGAADLLIIAPATANTISKIACGIDDTTVTTFATTAIGSKLPILLVPAMHYSMYRHPAVTENLKKVEQFGITVVPPRIEEGKAKIADISDIVREGERLLSNVLKEKKVLITSGRCSETVDDVRVLTTRSSGRMGRALAEEAYRLGADVTILHRHEDFLSFGKNIAITDAESMKKALLEELSNFYDLYISAAAISDFVPEKREGKIKSGTPVSLNLLPLPKLLPLATNKVKTIIAFKIGENSIIEGKMLLNEGVDIVAANYPKTMGSEYGNYTLLDKTGSVVIDGKKDEIAEKIFEKYINHIKLSTR